MCKINYFIKRTLSNSARLIEIIFQRRAEDAGAYPFLSVWAVHITELAAFPLALQLHGHWVIRR